MKPVKTIDVFFHEKSVGVLAEAADRRIAFSYDTDWLKNGVCGSGFVRSVIRVIQSPQHRCLLRYTAPSRGCGNRTYR